MSLKIYKSFEGIELEKYIINPLTQALTTMTRYSVLPIYMMQFMISKKDYMPRVVLTAYDNRNLITEIASQTKHLEIAMLDKLPKSIYPTVIVYPEDMDYRDIIFSRNDDWYYSSSYLIYGREMKDNIKSRSLDIYGLDLITDDSKSFMQIDLKWKLVPFIKKVKNKEYGGEDMVKIIPENCIVSIPFSVKPVHLPFSNYLNVSKSYSDILYALDNLANEKEFIMLNDKEVLTKLFNDIKDTQMIKVPGLPDVNIFKDFLKTRPDDLAVLSKSSKYSEDVYIRSVWLNTTSKSNHSKLCIFYRYIDDIYKSIIGNGE